MKKEPLPDLPPGYTVRENRLVGVEFLDENGQIVEQHPNDGNAIRRYVWWGYAQRMSKTEEADS